ncbi:MAG: hypothetical protein RJA22_897 [Verrucomicrobiota bacterium]|jgi:hypothetical protein
MHPSNPSSEPGPEKAGHASARRRRRRAVGGLALGILDGVPESRAEIVARGRRLISDPGYPTEEILRQIAQLLATRIERDPISY